ncbi:gastrula zinc finger protein XlCGF57.1-like [Maniola jurtina]|uniref:gastrula zinc finger protein XlCGF57.1-like n=1 Tax=Maniola jurtina TaxID=191418 RepID=UPI001E68F445|nr:gastrula zinc finger protein XlCGF57.1-like [Maniola jurtina]
MEQFHKSTCYADCLIEPKEEMLDDLITDNCEDDTDVIPKEELSSTSLHRDDGLNEHKVDMVMPIKTELTLSANIAQIRRQYELSQHEGVLDKDVCVEPTLAKIKRERRESASVDAGCSSRVAPLTARFATNNENNVRSEDADTVQKITNEQLDNQSFDINRLTKIYRLTNCVVKLYDVFKTHNKDVLIQDKSLVKKRTAISPCDSHSDTASEDFNSHIVKHNKDRHIIKMENIQPATNKVKDAPLLKKHTQRQRGKTAEKKELPSCDKQKQFKHKSDLAVHMKTYTSETKCCDLCQRKFTRKVSLIQHMNAHVRAYLNTFICDICQKTYTTKRNLKRHMKTHTGQKTYPCDICHKKFTQKSNLRIHIRTHTGDNPYSCHVCQKKFIQTGNFNTHMRSHIGVKPFCCDVCRKKFARRSTLTCHMSTHAGEKRYSCDLCEKKFTQKRCIDTHMRTHTGVNLFSCDLCQKKFAQKISLIRHIITHTGVKPFCCDICRKKFARKSILTCHMSTHTGVKPFCCNICRKKFARKNYLIRHIITHTGVKPFCCDICRKKFARKSILTGHMSTHTGVKPFCCNICRKKFARKNNLIRHIITHTGVKPFCCDICRKKFARKSILTGHMSTHTGVKPFCCNICRKKFTRKNDLNRHFMKTHT